MPRRTRLASQTFGRGRRYCASPIGVESTRPVDEGPIRVSEHRVLAGGDARV